MYFMRVCHVILLYFIFSDIIVGLCTKMWSKANALISSILFLVLQQIHHIVRPKMISR